MSPDRGQELPPAATHDFRQRKSKEPPDNAFGNPLINDAIITETKTHRSLRMSTSQPSFASRQQSHNDLSHKNDTAMDSQLPKLTAASVKSMSSTENSRRDSAISAWSQHRRRPKTSRSTSKRSLQSIAGDDLIQTVSHSGRRRPPGQRFTSSGSSYSPHTNIEEALALHARSREIFTSASRPTTSHAPMPACYGPYSYPGLYRSLSSTDALPISQYASQHATPFQSHAESSGFDYADEDDQYYTSSFPPTVTHWTSDEVRRREYAAIDRSNTGVRGLLKKLLPKCVSKGHTKFYNEKDGSDTGSVRRIRLDIPAEKEDEEMKTTKLPRHFCM